MNKTYLYIALAVIVVIVPVFVLTRGEEVAEEVPITAIKRVQTQTVADLAGKQDNITAYGQVVSATGVDVVPETSGVVRRVYRSLGEFVRAGTIVLELQNSSEAQQIVQAQAGIASAQAQIAQAESGVAQARSGVLSAENNLQKLQNGADAQVIANARLAVRQAETNVNSAQENLETSLTTILNSAINSVEGSFDQTFYSSAETNPSLRIVTDSATQRNALEQNRSALQSAITNAENQESSNSLSVSDITTVLSAYERAINALRQHIAAMPTSKITQAEKDRFTGILRSSNQTTDTLRGQLTSLRNAITNAEIAVTNAENNLSDLVEGADALDVASSQNSVDQAGTNVQSAQAQVQAARAGLAQARASLRSAQIAFEKTRVRAPVSGKISQIETRVGDLVGQSQQVFSVANENTLRIDTALSPSEVRRISVGTRVLIENRDEAFVSAIAPTVDDRTGKVTVQVLLRNPDQTLVAGAGVGLEIIPAGNESNQLDSVVDETVLYVPIDAIFVRSGVSYVYVVEDSRAVVREIKTKTLFGDQIEVLSGLELSDTIILNARTVKDNEEIQSIDKNKSETNIDQSITTTDDSSTANPSQN